MTSAPVFHLTAYASKCASVKTCHKYAFGSLYRIRLVTILLHQQHRRSRSTGQVCLYNANEARLFPTTAHIRVADMCGQLVISLS